MIKKGDIFERWTVVDIDEERNKKERERQKNGEIKCAKIYYICQCKCGKIKSVNKDSLEQGKSKSCGCLAGDLCKQNFTKDGTRNGRLYGIYYKMIRRCTNEKDVRFKNYGGKGIKICEEWINPDNGWLNFRQWSYANGYRDDLSIDRINVDGNYEPSNCRWVDIITQANNTTRNNYVTINGRTQTATQWCHEAGFHENLFYSRIKRGVAGEDLLKPPRHTYIVTNLKTNEINEFDRVSKFTEMINMSPSNIYTLLRKNNNVFVKNDFKVERICK